MKPFQLGLRRLLTDGILHLADLGPHLFLADNPGLTHRAAFLRSSFIS